MPFFSAVAWTGAAWSPWLNLGGSLKEPPAIASSAPNRIDVASVGAGESSAWHMTVSGAPWTGGTKASGWQNLGGWLNSQLSMVSWGPNRLDFFGRGGANACYHKWLTGSWSAYESLSGGFNSHISSVSWGPDRLDLFDLGGDNTTYHKAYDGIGWSGWDKMGAVMFSSPLVATLWGVNECVFSSSFLCWRRGILLILTTFMEIGSTWSLLYIFIN
jgi:hypothetical protein